MPENYKEEEFYQSQRVIDKTYFSKSFPNPFDPFTKKFAYKILDECNNEFILKDAVTLGNQISGRRQLKALFLLDEKRIIEKLIIQQFQKTDIPIKNFSKQASFTGKEVESLYLFLKSIKEVQFPSNETFNVNDAELSKMLINKEQANKIVSENLDIIQEALISNVTKNDIINFGYRKNQLEEFCNLLKKPGYFEENKRKIKEIKNNIGDEAVWQAFFEKNTWILGYGLDYIFNSGLDGAKLEQVTSGFNFYSKGKRIDALLKSQGSINSLCFCEIKLSTHHLLKKVKNSYREESWQISDELSGAIAQVQRTVQKALKEISTKTEIKGNQDSLTGEELYLYNPKSFIIIGNLNEFFENDRVNEIKFSSFEMFRKSLKNVEIITYDELYERAYYICNKK